MLGQPIRLGVSGNRHPLFVSGCEQRPNIAWFKMAKPILTLSPGFQESFFETCYQAGLSPEQAGGLYKQAVDQQLAALNTTDTAGGVAPPQELRKEAGPTRRQQTPQPVQHPVGEFINPPPHLAAAAGVSDRDMQQWHTEFLRAHKPVYPRAAKLLGGLGMDTPDWLRRYYKHRERTAVTRAGETANKVTGKPAGWYNTNVSEFRKRQSQYRQDLEKHNDTFTTPPGARG